MHITLCDKKMQRKTSDHFWPKIRHMKYASLLGADCCVLDTVQADMVPLRDHIQF